MKYVDADKIAVALGKMPTWPDFDVRGESGDARGETGDAPYCVCCCSTNECECHTDTHKDIIPDRILREAEMIYEEEVKKEYHKMYKNPAKIPNCTGIIQRDRATIVTWDDNTKTTIVAEKGFYENEHMLFDAFCIAFTKKMLGSTTNILKTIEANDTDKQIRFAKEMEKNFRKQRDLDRKEVDRIRREKKYNDMVDEEFMRMRAVEEAKKRHKDYIRSHKEK